MENRERLPEALRILLTDYPRDIWQTHDHFTVLIRFWLERHVMFRRLLSAMSSDAEKFLDNGINPRRYGSRLTRYSGIFIGDLHEHHTIEDAHYFPKLRMLDPRVSEGFDLLDQDHETLDRFLDEFASFANSAVSDVNQSKDAKPAAAAFADHLARMTGSLDRHLLDEEDLIVPILLKFRPPELT